MAITGEQAYRERYKRTNEQARGDIRVEGAGRAGSYISSRAGSYISSRAGSYISSRAEGRGAEDR